MNVSSAKAERTTNLIPAKVWVMAQAAKLNTKSGAIFMRLQRGKMSYPPGSVRVGKYIRLVPADSICS